MTDQPEMPPPDQAPEPSQSAPKPVPTDWRLIAIVAVAVIFLVAVFVNKRYYSKKVSATPPTTLPGTPQPPAGPAAPPLSLAEQYAAMLRNREMEAKDGIYQFGDRTVLFARPPISVQPEDDPRKVKEITPGRLFDVTRCADGVRPEMLFRRALFANNRPVFMDYFPPLGLYPEPKMVFKPAAEVTINIISDQQRVVGVTIKGETRAYPLKMLNYHEVINDTVGGVPIVIAWTALAQSATVWERTLPDQSVAAFGSAGLMYQSTIVMYDKATNSLWWSTLGQALTGPLAGGAPLTPVQATVTNWKAWKESAPQSLVLTGTDPVLPLNYELNPAVPQDYFGDNSLAYPVYGFDVEKNLLIPKAYVLVAFGSDGKSAKAYVAQLLAQRASSGPVEDTLGGEKVTLQFEKGTGILTAQTQEGKPLLTREMYWIACVGAYPGIALWEEEKIRRDAEAARAAPAPATGTTEGK